MKAIPAENFAVVKDTKRNLIVHCGTWEECEVQARAFNWFYKSTVYETQGWNH